MPAFDITRPASSAELDFSRKSSVPFQITNLTIHSRKVRLQVMVDDDGDLPMFSIEGTPERNLRPNGSATVTVDLEVPLGVRPGTRQFRLKVVDVDSPDEFFAESQSVAFTVPQEAPTKVTLRVWWLLVLCAMLWSLLNVKNSSGDALPAAMIGLVINGILSVLAIAFSWGDRPQIKPKVWWLTPVIGVLLMETFISTVVPVIVISVIGVAIVLIRDKDSIFTSDSVSVDVPNPPRISKPK
jgi:hypothetical protein